MTNLRHFYKLIFILPLLMMTLAACSTNQATGRNQFTGLMPASQEAAIGAQEHKKILAQFGGEVKDKALRDYVTRVGGKIVPHTERPDVNYTFTLLDSPIVNAFAVPGGYVYVTRGILTLAKNEAELAAVIAHEIGHITARHSAERYSTSVVTGIGANILSAALNVNGASQALGLGTNLYLKSYSRSQEHEADDLGVRYLSRAGYNPDAMANFLQALENHSALEAAEAGRKQNNIPNYLSTHPVTAERITRSFAKADTFPEGANRTNRIDFLKAINGMEVGDSAAQGFVDNGRFVHPELGFLFTLPANYRTENSAQAFIAQSRNRNGGALVLTSGKKRSDQSIDDYLRQNVLKGDLSTARDFGTNTINSLRTASVERSGRVNNTRANIRTIVYQFGKDRVYQIDLIMPQTAAQSDIKRLQDSAFSFRKMTSADKRKYRPKRMAFRVAKAGDSVAKFASLFPYDDNLNERRFRVLNGLKPNDLLIARQSYKIITQ